MVAHRAPSGAGWLGRFRLFRYEVRCWRGGHRSPTSRFAVGGPRRLTTDPDPVRRLLALVVTVPTPVWDLKWNSNSVIAWLLDAAGLPTDALEPPPGGRAPGWSEGLAAARTTAAAGSSAHSRRAGDHGALVGEVVLVARPGSRAARGSRESALDQAVVERVAHELGARGAAELLLDVRAVGLDGAHGEVQLCGDLRVRVAERDQPQHLDLALAQVVGRPAGRAGRGERAPSAGLRYVSPSAAARTAATSSSSAASLRT